MNTKEAMMAALRKLPDKSCDPGERRTVLEITADFVLEQMRPLEARIAELERQLAVADSAMTDMLRCFGDQRTQCTNEYLDAVDGLGNALAQIRGGATSSTVSTS